MSKELRFNEKIMALGSELELEWFEKVIKDKDDFMKRYKGKQKFFRYYLEDNESGKFKNVTFICKKMKRIVAEFSEKYDVKINLLGNEKYTHTSRKHRISIISTFSEISLWKSLKKNGCKISIRDLVEISCLYEIGCYRSIHIQENQLRELENVFYELGMKSDLICLYLKNSECNHMNVLVVDNEEYENYISLNCNLNEIALKYVSQELENLNNSRFFKNNHVNLILKLKRFIELKEMQEALENKNYIYNEKREDLNRNKVILVSNDMSSDFRDILYRMGRDSRGTLSIEKVI